MANVVSAAATPARPLAPLTYVYAVLPAGTPVASGLVAGRIRGIEGAPVRAIEQNGLLAVVSDVPAAEFEAAPLNRLMGDLTWLGPRAEAHQAVNAQVFALGEALLPLAFGAIYRTDDAVRAFLASQRVDLQARLAAVRDGAEWVVTLRRDDAAAGVALERGSAALRMLAQEMAASAPGRAYLLRRRQAGLVRQERERVDRVAAQAVVGIVESLGGRSYPERVATEAEGATAGLGGRLIFRLSALVARDAAGQMAEAVERLDREWSPRGYALAVTGPWPPYRFGALGNSSAGPDADDAPVRREAPRGR